MISAKRKRVKEEDPTTNSMGEEIATVLRSIRDVQPADYLLKIKSFSVLSESKIKKFVSDEFESGGYKWKLHLYPNGKKDGNGSNYISLYLAITDTKSLSQGWEVNVQLKFFVYDHIKDKYLTIQETGGSIRRYHVMKTEWGFDQLLPLDLFKNTLSGYLFEDSCVFGVEIFVIQYGGVGQCLDMKNGTMNANTYTWKVERFLTIKEEFLESNEFKIGELQWKMLLYPEGMSKFKGKGISLFLKVADYSKLPLKTRVYAEYKLRMKCQMNPSQVERSYAIWFCNSYGYGNPNFMSLSYLKNKSNGYIVNDTLVVEVEISIIGVTKNLS